jgi:hypothetical protein
MNKSPDEIAASRVRELWFLEYGVRMSHQQSVFDKLSQIEQEAYSDLLYKTFPYLSRVNPYNNDD